MTGIGLIILALAICTGAYLVSASLSDLQAAITSNTAAVTALTAAAGTIQPPHDFQSEVDAIAANTTAVNAVTTQLGGTPP